jgi:hypothetical protein
MTYTPEHETELANRLSEIKPCLIGWRRATAARILDPKKGPPFKGWQEEAQEIIDHHNAEVLANHQSILLK